MHDKGQPAAQGFRIDAFAGALAARTPAPGGGAAAAAAVAMGAALVQMAAGYAKDDSLDEPGLNQMKSAREVSRRAQSAAIAAIDDDSFAYMRYRQAVRLPRTNPAEKVLRRSAIENAAKAASATSVAVLESALAVIEAGETVARIGNPRLASDAGGGALLARAAAQIALANLDVNLRSCPEDADRRSWQELADSARRKL